MRLNKYLSDAGVCSRREADRLTEAGEITVNGKRAETGMQVESGDVVVVKGKTVVPEEKKVYLAFNKPRGIVCTAEKREKKREQAKQRIYRQKQKLQDTPEHKVSQAAVRRIRQEGTIFLHRKVSEAEQENAAVEGAHKTEQRVEDAYSFVKRRYGGRKAWKPGDFSTGGSILYGAV